MAHVSPVERPGRGSPAGAAVRSGRGTAVLGRPTSPGGCPVLAQEGALDTRLRSSVSPPGDHGGPSGGLFSLPKPFVGFSLTECEPNLYP